MILFDTGVLIALHNPTDPQHRRAATLFQEALRGGFGQLVSTDYVLDEGLTFLMSRKVTRSIEEGYVAMFHGSRDGFAPTVTMRHTTPDVVEEAIELHFREFDRRLSLTDCTLAVFAKRLEATVATFDRRLASIVPSVEL